MPTNRLAIISLVSSLLTIISFCIGFAPIPMTALVCYPAAILGGIISLVSGVMALRQGVGGWMAWVGIISGAVIILAVLCFTSLTLALFPYISDFVKQMWPSAAP